MTAVPPRRRQQPLNLDGVWLVTDSPDGTKDVPGMSVVADARGFTIVGPEPGSERTIPWEQTTGFTCQRPARLPDGSPATMLEVGLANGRVLQLMLPVNRVPPSETVVVETELAVMSEQYGGRRPSAAGRDAAPLEKAAADVAREGSTRHLDAPRFETQERVERPAGLGAGVGAGVGVSAGSGARAGAGARANGSSANGVSANGVSSPQPTGLSFAPEPSGSSVAVAPVEPDAAPTPQASFSTAPAPAQVAPSEPAPMAAPTYSPPAQPETQLVAQPETQSTAQPESHSTAQSVAQPEAHSTDASQGDDEDNTERREARENRLLYMLVALIGVVVVVLIAEVVLILFVLNHNTTSHNTSSMRETSALVYSPRDTR